MGNQSTYLSKYSLVFGLLILIIFFSLMKPEVFPTVRNVGSILSDNTILTIIALGIMVPLVVGQFDLSPGFVASLAVMLTAGLLSHQNLPWPLVLVIVLAIGAMIGLFMGLLVGYLELNSLIVSLGVGSAVSGLVLFYSNGEIIFQGIPKSFIALGQTRLFGFIPLPFIYSMVLAVFVWFFMTLRPIGQKLYAIGGNRQAARLIGIDSKKYIVGAFVFSSTLASIAGFLQVSRLGAGHPTSAQAFLLPAFAAAFLGATSFRPGFYNTWGTVFAVFLVGTGTTGLFMLGADAYVQPIFNGVVLIFAITFARLAVLRKERLLER